MGWSGGTDVCISIWERMRILVHKKDRAEGLAIVLDALIEKDWDCVNEIESEKWPEIKEAFKIIGYDDEQ